MARVEGLATWVPQGKIVYVLRRAWRGRMLCEVAGSRTLIPQSELLPFWGAPGPSALLLWPFDSSDLEACAAVGLR